MTLKLNGSSSGYTAIDAPAAAGSNTLTLPTSNGSANQYLKNSGTPGALEFATLAAGKILQIVTAEATSSVNTGDDWHATTPTNIGPTVSITPSATSSKVIVIFTGGIAVYGGTAVNKIGIVALENTTSGTLFGTSRIGANMGVNDRDWWQLLNIIACDSPNSTSAQTYQLAAGRYDSSHPNSVYLGYGVPSSGQKQQLIALEVAA